jgi:hypothetical protein
MKGSPDDPMSTEEIMRKFKSCLAFGLNADISEADRLMDVTLALDKTDNVAELVRAFPTRHRSRPESDRAAE